MSFLAITVNNYLDIMRERADGSTEELTWLKQFRQILQPYLESGRSILDVGLPVQPSLKGYWKNEILAYKQKGSLW